MDVEKKFAVPFSGAADEVIGGEVKAAIGTPLYSYRNSKSTSVHDYLETAGHDGYAPMPVTGQDGHEPMHRTMKSTRGA